MKHLVIFYTEIGIITAIYSFEGIRPTIDEIKGMQEDMKQQKNLNEYPAVVNWLPVTSNDKSNNKKKTISRTTRNINCITTDLDRISELDGIVADKVEKLANEVHAMVEDALQNHSEASVLNHEDK